MQGQQILANRNNKQQTKESNQTIGRTIKVTSKHAQQNPHETQTTKQTQHISPILQPTPSQNHKQRTKNPYQFNITIPQSTTAIPPFNHNQYLDQRIR